MLLPNISTSIVLFSAFRDAFSMSLLIWVAPGVKHTPSISVVYTCVSIVKFLLSRCFYLCHYLYMSLSHSDPGACFLCNDCPSDEEDDSPDPASCPSRPRGEGSASCVETTAYALRALLEYGDTEKTVCLAEWLIQIKSGSGGFYSSQV